MAAYMTANNLNDKKTEQLQQLFNTDPTLVVSFETYSLRKV